MKLIGRWFPKRSANFQSMLSIEYNDVAPLQYSAFICFAAVAPGLDDVSNNRLKYTDVRRIRLLASVV